MSTSEAKDRILHLLATAKTGDVAATNAEVAELPDLVNRQKLSLPLFDWTLKRTLSILESGPQVHQDTAVK